MNRTKVQINVKLIVALASCTLCLGCKGADGGFAPSMTVPGVAALTTKNNLKNGSQVKTSNGWDLQMDSTDPVKNLTTSNGWKIEVKYE